jgi:putative membrane protein
MATVFAASCSTKPSAPVRPPIPPRTAVPTSRPVPAASPDEYLAQVASIDLYVVRSSELVLARSTQPTTRALAERLIEEHRGLAAQLSMAGRRLNLLPAAALRPREAALLAWLETHPQLDEAYRRQQALVHERAFALHDAFARRGESPTLRPVAANGAAVERSHYALVTAR